MDDTGFRLKLPTDLNPFDELVIEARSGDRRQALKLTSRLAAAPAEPERPRAQPPPAEEPRTPTAGFLERCAGGVLKGWAVNPNNPSVPPSVDIFDDERFLGVVAATIDRPRLRESGAPSGARGFEFQLPEGPVVPAERLRARITGTRFDLKRSRAFPGDGSGADRPIGDTLPNVGAAPAPEPRAAQRPERVGFVVCGAGPPAATAETVAACRRQDWSGIAVAVVSEAAGAWDGAETFGPGDGEALGEWLTSKRAVVLLAPGQEPDGEVARAVAEADSRFEVLHSAELGPDADLRVALGAASGGLAASGDVFALMPATMAMELAQEGLAAAERWLASLELRWGRVAARFGTPSATDLQSPRRPSPGWSLDRLSLCVWSGWDHGVPPALTSLLGATEALELEVLVPAAARAALRDHPLARTGRRFDLRIVDPLRAQREPAATWRALSLAATGPAVVVCRGDVDVTAATLAEAVRWAMRPGVGAVSVVRRSDGAESAQPSLGACAAFMVVSRAALAEAEGLPPASCAELDDDLAFGLRLRGANRRSVVLYRDCGPAQADRIDLAGAASRLVKEGLSAPVRAAVAAYSDR